MSSKPVLGYRDIRGLAQPIRIMLKYLGVDFEDKMYGCDPGPHPTVDSWKADKFNLGLDFPNVPYWIEDNFKLTESRAILRYIARTRGGQLFPQKAEDDAVITMVEGVAMDLQMALIDLAYSKTGVPDEPLETKLAPKFQQLNNFMKGNKYILNEQISYVDFYLYEVLVQYSKFNKQFLKPYPELEKYKQSIESLPQLSEYIKATDHLLCYSISATLQF